MVGSKVGSCVTMRQEASLLVIDQGVTVSFCTLMPKP